MAQVPKSADRKKLVNNLSLSKNEEKSHYFTKLVYLQLLIDNMKYVFLNLCQLA